MAHWVEVPVYFFFFASNLDVLWTVINLYNANGFELVDTDTIKISERPQFIACTKDCKNRKVLVTHHSGCICGYFEHKELFTVIPCIDGSKSKACGITCDENDNVYVGVSHIEENTGHIHKYSLTHDAGSPPKYSLVFQECIAKGLLQPQGMDYANGCLYVANTRSVLIFSQKDMEQQMQHWAVECIQQPVVNLKILKK